MGEGTRELKVVSKALWEGSHGECRLFLMPSIGQAGLSAGLSLLGHQAGQNRWSMGCREGQREGKTNTVRQKQRQKNSGGVETSADMLVSSENREVVGTSFILEARIECRLQGACEVLSYRDGLVPANSHGVVLALVPVLAVHVSSLRVTAGACGFMSVRPHVPGSMPLCPHRRLFRCVCLNTDFNTEK